MVLVVVAAVILIPIGYAILGGFKANGQLVGDPGAIIPSPWVFSNYTDVLFGPNSGVFWREVLNSLIVAVIAVTATVVPASLAAFVFARIAFRGREAMYTLFTLGLLFPAAVAILPLYILVRDLGLSGNFLGVALPGGRLRAAADDHHPAAVLPEHPGRARGCCADGRLLDLRVLLAGAAATRPPGARHGQRPGDRDAPGTPSCCR